jgi:uncharacterized protein (DUF2147 family)
MGAIFEKPKRPYIAPAPATTVPATTAAETAAETAAAEAAGEAERKKRRRAAGGSTVLTSPLGVVGSASVTKKTLLGE